MEKNKTVLDIHAERLEYIYEVMTKLDKAFFPKVKTKSKPNRVELKEQTKADILKSMVLKGK
jgi:hypothetical protein